MKEEIWKDITGYEGSYQVSNFGRVKSLERMVSCGLRPIRVPERILKLSVGTCGYHEVGLCLYGKVKRFKVHRLVALSFLENPDSKPEINHIDGCKTNNLVSNLVWASASENAIHAYGLGLRRANNNKIVLNQETGVFYESAKAAALAHGINHKTLMNRLHGSHKNYTPFIYA